MYTVGEEVEILKGQFKELIEKFSQIEQNNEVKKVASPEKLTQFQAQLQTGSPLTTKESQGSVNIPGLRMNPSIACGAPTELAAAV